MAPKVVADFVGQLRTSGADQFHKSRVLLSKRQLMFVEPDGRTKIPLKKIFGVAMNDVDPELQQFFDVAVRLTYRRGDSAKRVWIRAQPETLERFQRILFKALFGGATVSVYHPARVGGQLCNPAPRTARPKLAQSKTGFVADDPICTFDHSSIIQVVPGSETADPISGPVISIVNLRGKTVYRTAVGADSKRLLNLLRCHFEVSAALDTGELRTLGLSSGAVRGLVWLYAGGDRRSLPRAADDTDADPKRILEELSEAELVTNGTDEVELTRRGMAAASVCYESYADELA
jgi:helix-turn-helix protein